MDYETVVDVFVCIALVMGAIICFAGFKIINVSAPLGGLLAGVTLGISIGIATESFIIGFLFVVLFSVGLVFASAKYSLAGIYSYVSVLAVAAFYFIFENWFFAIVVGSILSVISIIYIRPAGIILTAFSGAGIVLASAYFLIGNNNNMHNYGVTSVLWILTAVAGTMCQCLTAPKSRYKKTLLNYLGLTQDNSRTFSERKYPGMQRAYRNYCIKCGLDLYGSNEKCPKCGFSFDD